MSLISLKVKNMMNKLLMSLPINELLSYLDVSHGNGTEGENVMGDSLQNGESISRVNEIEKLIK